VNCGTWTGGNPIVGQTPNGPEYGGRDIGIDQFVPVSKTGTEYVLIKGLGADNERTFVIATEDNTDIYLDGDPTEVAQLDAGDYYVITNIPYSVENNLYLESSAPVYVVQTINGGPPSGNPGVGGEMDNEDKNGMAIVPPLDCNGSRLVEIPDANFVGEFDPYGEAFINIVALSGISVEVNNVELTDPQPIIGTTEYVTYQVQGYEGDVIVSADEPVLVSLITGGLNLGAAGYFSGFTREFEVIANYQGDLITAEGEIYEGCGELEITIERSPLDQGTEQTVYFDLSGTAVEGLDYSPITDQMVFDVGETEITFTIFVFDDDLAEGSESIIINAYLEDEVCATDQFEIIINDVEELIVDLGEDTTACVGEIIEIDPVVTGGVDPYIYEWSTGEETESITVLSGGTYYLTVTDDCENATNVAVDSVDVGIQAQVSVSLPEDTTICSGTSITLTATSNVEGASFVWQPGGLTGSQITVSPNSTELYTVIATSPQAGCNSAPESMFVYVENGPAVEISGNDSICPGEITVLTASSESDLEYTWDPGKLTGDSIVVSPPVTTTYTVTGLASDGCNGFDEFTIVVDAPLVEVDGDNTLCLGDTTTLTATSIFTDLEFNWYPGEIEGSEISVSPDQTTTYTVVGFSEAGCNIEQTFSVSVLPLPEVSISGDESICLGESTTLLASSASSQMSYEWNDGTENDEIVVSPDQSSEYSVIGFDGECYSEEELFTIDVNPIPEVFPPADTVICAGSGASLSASSNVSGAEFYWEPAQATGNPVTVSADEPTIFTVVAVAENCSSVPASFFIDIYESCNCEFEVPNIFSPNGDNINEELERIGGEECLFTNYELKIFNRWGNLIWETNNPDDSWDGLKNGDEVSDGIYYWSMSYSHLGSEAAESKSGYVTIAR
jgi:gliding motility-associated-like protein